MATEQKRQKLDNFVLQSLPKEVWCIIFSFLSKESRKNATSTCKLWFEIIRGDSRFSGNIAIPLTELQNSSFCWDNWPSLKTLAISNSSFPTPKRAFEAMKDIDFKKCQSLEKVTFGVNFDLAELPNNTTTAITGENTIVETENLSASTKSKEKFMKDIGTVLALVFNPKSDIDLFKLEHMDKLEIHMRSQSYDNIEKTMEIMKIIGKAAINLQWLIVGGNSFDHSEFFETGFKNFGRSLKVFTLKNGCFENSLDHQDDIHGAHVNSVDTFFKSLNENCPNLNSLNLGSAHQLRCVNTYNQLRDYEKLFSMAGFEMVKELNADFTFINEGDGNVNFNWFFGLINDFNSIETLSLNGLSGPFFGKSTGDMASIKEKFKKLKKCQISFQEDFGQYFEYTLYNGWDKIPESYKEYASELAKDLDKTFADRSTEFKVLIQANKCENEDPENQLINTEEGICFQIIKMPFKNSVITRLE